jgi:hypothetical protein
MDNTPLTGSCVTTNRAQRHAATSPTPVKGVVCHAKRMSNHWASKALMKSSRFIPAWEQMVRSVDPLIWG